MTLHVYGDENVTVAKAVYRNGSETFTGMGVAFRHPKDKPNRTVGELFAVERALKDLARRVGLQAWGEMDRNYARAESSAMDWEKMEVQP